MKTKLIITGIIGLLMQTAVFAQDNTGVSPEWVSEKGWWMVESNIHSPKQHTVYFYNNVGVLVSSVEDMLPEKLFIRTHRSFIVSINKIKSFTNELAEVDKTDIPIGKLFRNGVMKAFSLTMGCQ